MNRTNNYTNEQLNAIMKGAFSKESDTLDWYDGPLLTRCKVNGEMYYYCITDIMNYTWVCMKFNPKYHAEHEVFCMHKINVLLANNEYWSEVIDAAFVIHFQQSGDHIHQIDIKDIPFNRDSVCLDLASCEYLVNGKSRIAIVSSGADESVISSDYEIFKTKDAFPNVLSDLALDVACNSAKVNEKIDTQGIKSLLSQNGVFKHQLEIFRENGCFDDEFPSIPVLINVRVQVTDASNLESSDYTIWLDFYSNPSEPNTSSELLQLVLHSKSDADDGKLTSSDDLKARLTDRKQKSEVK